MYDPHKGEILVDNLSFKDHNLYNFRNNIGYIPQESLSCFLIQLKTTNQLTGKLSLRRLLHNLMEGTEMDLVYQ